MATKTFLGQAGAVVQIDSIAVGGTWVAGDKISIKIGNSTLAVLIGTGQTAPSTITTVLRNAINARSVDENLQGSETRLNAGQLLAEFRDVEAIIDPADSTKVLVRSRVAGVPFGIPGSPAIAAMTSTTTSGAGTVTRASVQASTGPNHWDNATNWDSGTVPANNDIVVFTGCNVSCKYGLPNGIDILLQMFQSYTGWLGLPVLNTDNPGAPYREYRQTNLGLDDSGSNTTLTHVFGIGAGSGSPLINVKYVGIGDIVVNATVFNTGTPLTADTYALNLAIDRGSASGGTISVLNGSVNLGEQWGIGPNFAVLKMTNGRVYCYNIQATVAITQSGGELLFVEDNLLSATAVNRTLLMYGGTCTCRDLTSTGTVTATVTNAKLLWNTSKTIDTLILGSHAILDAEQDSRGFTVTNCDLYEGASLLDEFARGTYTNGIDLNRCGIDDVTIRVGNNRRLTLGTAS